MPQEFHVVQCYKCKTFQVQIVKKVNKFDCKMCGEKQSVKKEYGRGTGKDCRLHVQKLNELRIQNESKSQTSPEMYEESLNVSNNEATTQQTLKNSKWSEFISIDDNETQNDDKSDLEFEKYTFERPNKRKKPSKQSKLNVVNNCETIKNKKKCRSSDNISDNTIESFTEDINEENETSVKSFPVESTSSTVVSEIHKSVTIKQSKWNDYITNVNSKTDNDNVELLSVEPNKKFVKSIFESNDNDLDNILNF